MQFAGFKLLNRVIAIRIYAKFSKKYNFHDLFILPDKNVERLYIAVDVHEIFRRLCTDSHGAWFNIRYPILIILIQSQHCDSSRGAIGFLILILFLSLFHPDCPRDYRSLISVLPEWIRMKMGYLLNQRYPTRWKWFQPFATLANN